MLLNNKVIKYTEIVREKQAPGSKNKLRETKLRCIYDVVDGYTLIYSTTTIN